MGPGNGSIPDWDRSGVIPALDQHDPTSRNRSPYVISMRQLVNRFGLTEHRRKLLAGLLDYRARLHDAGLLQGFQWINGSFVEDVERMQDRPPNDIDVVTFHHVPEGYTEETFYNEHQGLFDQRSLATAHSVHAYYVSISSVSVEFIVQNCTYWYSLWSHGRDQNWKGYLQVGLTNAEDDTAKRQLDRMADKGAQE